jgi:hypothetical protein
LWWAAVRRQWKRVASGDRWGGPRRRMRCQRIESRRLRSFSSSPGIDSMIPLRV